MVDKNKSNGVMWAAGGNHLNIVTYLFGWLLRVMAYFCE